MEFTDSVRIRNRYAKDGDEVIGERRGTQTDHDSSCPISNLLQVDHKNTTLE